MSCATGARNKIKKKLHDGTILVTLKIAGAILFFFHLM